MTAAEFQPAPVCGTALAAIERLNAKQAAITAAARQLAEQAEGVDFFTGPPR